MKSLIRSFALSFLLIAASVAFGGVPPLNITVSMAGGKAAFKGSTGRSGAFVTGSLKPGSYVVQFNSNDAALKGKRYSLVVSAGKKNVSAAVPGEKFAGGGVAMKVDVGNVASIRGQVAAETGESAPMGTNGKPMVWIPKVLGSSLAPHWAESDSAEAKQVQTSASLSTKNIQDRQDHGISSNQRGDGR